MSRKQFSCPFSTIHLQMTELMTLFFFLFACTNSTLDNNFPQLPLINQDVEEVFSTETKEAKTLSISLTGEIRGEIEPCGCPTLPYGGFERRANAIQKIKDTPYQQPLFQLDAGEMLLKGFFSNKGEQKEERAKLIASLAKDIGVDAWAVGPSDLMAIGLTELQSLDSPPKISATWKNEEGEWLFPPFIVLEKQGIRLGIIGFSGEPTDPELRKQISYQEPIDIISEVLPKIPKDIDLLIGLGSIDDLQAQELSKKVSELALILSTEGSNYQPPFLPFSNPENALIIEAPKQGRFVQQIQLVLGGEASQAPTHLVSEQEWRDWNFLQHQESTPRKLELEKVFLQHSQGNNLFYTELIPLSESYEKKNPITNKIDQFAQDTIQKAEEIAQSHTTPFEPGFASSGRCASCHTKEIAKWSFSKHARAWETMIIEGQTKNPECITCHSTGFGQKGGFGEPSVNNIRKYKAVQCEACHGPMRGHPEENSIHSQPVSPETCLVCHDEANSPNFQWERYLRLATCQD
jgi:2',3'-cyclic-nucleotide 2'-phosphodiesterase (5'-nucleotidase family)